MFKTLFSAALLVLTAAPLAAQQPAQQPQQERIVASGGFILAYRLYVSCNSQSETEILACRTYLMAVADSMAMHKDNRWAPPVLCNAEDLTVDRLAEIYVDYMRRNQDKARWTAASTAYNALSERFPCQAQQPGG